jgi:hypothetical protein
MDYVGVIAEMPADMAVTAGLLGLLVVAAALLYYFTVRNGMP